MKKLIIIKEYAEGVPKTNERLCIGCGVCMNVCPVEGLIELVEEEVVPGVFLKIAEIREEKKDIKVAFGTQSKSLKDICKECKKCVIECPAEARYFVKERDEEDD